VSNNSDKRNDSEGILNHIEILRTKMTDAKSIGIRDRNKIEQLATQVIEPFEWQQPSTWNEASSIKIRREKRTFTESEIRTATKDILVAEEPSRPQRGM